MNKRFKRIYIEITNICNLECRFCPKTSRKKEFISIENFEYTLKQIKPYTDYIYLHIKGEPLIHPEIDKILDLCGKYGLKVNLTTNGMLLLDKKEILISKDSIRQINISLHSFEQNAIKGFTEKEYIQNILTAVKELNDHSKVIVALRLWNLQRDNINNQNHTIMKALEQEYGITDIQNNITRGIKLCDRIYLNQDFEFEWPDINKEVISQMGKCYGLIQQIGILVDGTVVPCCLDQEGDIKLGNIYTKGFTDIINQTRCGDIIEGFRNNRLVENLCTKCGYATRFKNKE